MEQENLEEYKVEVIEKYNEVTKNARRNEKIFAACTITSAILTMGVCIFANDFYDKYSELFDNYTLRSLTTTALFSLSYQDWKKNTLNYDEKRFSSIDNLEEYHEQEEKSEKKASLCCKICSVVLLGFSALESIFDAGNIIPLITMSPMVAYFGTASKQMKNVSNEYKKVLTKIKKK